MNDIYAWHARPSALVALAAAFVLAACQTPPATSAAEVGEYRAGSGILKGYLEPSQLPDSLALLPSPPAVGSPQASADIAAHRAASAVRGTSRWQLAATDANLHFPEAGQAFACALGVPIGAEATPHLNMLLRRTLTDAGLATYRAKDTYKRTRPFVELKDATCTPDEEAKLAKDGSYPSGHTSIGWAWALVLTELAPDRADALLQRGRAYGASRIVCGVHWASDVEAGRVIGAATVARLHADPTFNAQMAAAKAEIERQRASGAKPAGDCAAEKAALAL